MSERGVDVILPHGFSPTGRKSDEPRVLFATKLPRSLVKRPPGLYHGLCRRRRPGARGGERRFFTSLSLSLACTVCHFMCDWVEVDCSLPSLPRVLNYISCAA